MLPNFTPLTAEELRIVADSIDSDPASVVLKLHGKKGVDSKRIAQQVTARQKARQKLPDWFGNPDIFFPPPLSVEQASSQATARYKASLTSGSHLIDLTLGMGVDTLAFSKCFSKVTGYEINPELAAITAHNLSVLGAENVTVLNQNGEHVAEQSADCIYADPARRDAEKRKTVAFEDCFPDILTLLPRLFSQAPEIIIKSSPLIDIDRAVLQLGNVSEVHVIGYQKECKEVVFIVRSDVTASYPAIHAVVITDTGIPIHRLHFSRRQEHLADIPFGDPQGYLYEPHPAFMKAGAFNTLAAEYNLVKVAPNSHLYSSGVLHTDFPGRYFQISEVVSASGFAAKKNLPDGKGNLTLRNFPANPDDLRKKWRLKDGGENYLFATTLSSKKKVVIMTKKVVN